MKGRPVQRQAVLGLLLLSTGFARIPGDIGHPDTFSFAMRHRVVTDATAGRVVQGGAAGLVDGFVAAGRQLVAEGVAGIVTSCGFLVLHQAELARRIGVPVATSSLLQVPMAQALLPPGRSPGILTIDAASLTPAHLAAAGIGPTVPIAGMAAESHFARVFLAEAEPLDPVRAEAELVALADELLARRPETGALVLECTNMGPYTAAVARATGLPVLDVRSLVQWFHASLAPAAK